MSDLAFRLDFDDDSIDAFRIDAFSEAFRFTSGPRSGGYHDPRNDPGAPPHDLLELLNQTEWWRPKVGPPVRVREMTDTHRLHTARFAINRAAEHLQVDFRRLVALPLVGALLDGLPRPGHPGWDDLLRRCEHWSTCPRNRDLAAPGCSPECMPRTDRPAPSELTASSGLST